MILAPFSCALRIHLIAMGWFSAAFEPSMRKTLAFSRSAQWLVIAPRPKEAPRLGTVGLCQSRLMLHEVGAEEPPQLVPEVGFLIGVLRAAQKSDGVGAVGG